MSNRFQIPVILLGCFLFQSSLAQTYKVKNDELFRDKKRIGTIAGEIGITALADLVFKNIDGDEILHVKEGWFKADYPTMEPVQWLEFTFIQHFDKVVIKSGGHMSKRQLIRFQFENRDIGIYPDGFKWEELEVLKKEDYSKQLNEDTLRLLDEINFYQTALATGKVERDYSMPVSFRPIPGAVDMYWINQGINLKSEPYEIGRLGIVSRPGSFGAIKRTIIIMKRLKEPIMKEGELVEFLEAGHIEMDAFPKLFTYVDGVEHKDINFNNLDPVEKIYEQAVKYMIINEYL